MKKKTPRTRTRTKHVFELWALATKTHVFRDPAPASTSATASLDVAAGPSAPEPASVMSAWSDDEDNDEYSAVGADSVAELKAKRKADLGAEFPTKFSNYRQAAAPINWRELATKHGLTVDLPAEGQISALDLWTMPMGLVL